MSLPLSATSWIRRNAVAVLLGLIALSVTAEQRVHLLTDSGLQAWEEKEFKGRTQYTLIEHEGSPAFKAHSRASASGMFREIQIDLEKTPYLHWRWRVDNTLGNVDETSKAGDDYAARVYVVVSGGLFFWRTRAVNYVWSSNRPVGDVWPNAYTGNAKMFALRSGQADTGQWREERRNVREDLRRLFGEDITRIHAVAVMTDTDNSGGEATAYYGGLYFSAQ